MICSKTKLDSELDTTKQNLIDNGYPEDVLVSCIKDKPANISSEKQFGPEKCPVYLKLPWIGNVSSRFENQINKAITSCFYAVKPRAAYNTRVMLPSAKKDSIPTIQKSCVVYEFSCRCEARYIGHTTQRLADRLKQYVSTSIRTKNNSMAFHFSMRVSTVSTIVDEISRVAWDCLKARYMVVTWKDLIIKCERELCDQVQLSKLISMGGWETYPYNKSFPC